MDKLVFRKNADKYDEEVIEVGHYCKRNNGEIFFSSVLDIVPKEEIVMTDCGDSYMDYSVDFDTFLAVAGKIKELRKAKHGE